MKYPKPLRSDISVATARQAPAGRHIGGPVNGKINAPGTKISIGEKTIAGRNVQNAPNDRLRIRNRNGNRNRAIKIGKGNITKTE